MEFDWDDSSLSIEPFAEGPAIKITKDMVAAAVLKMKEGKACGPSEIVIQMVKAGGDAMLDIIFVDAIIRQQVDIDSMQFGFMPGRSSTDAIFILRQMQEKHHLKRKTMYAAFVDLEKQLTESLVRCYGGA